MFGASPVLAESFDISVKEARVVLAHWMSWASQNPYNFADLYVTSQKENN